MARVKRGTIATKKRRRILRLTKGYRWARKKKERAAKEALLHAWAHAYRDRRRKKREKRKLWQTKINAAARQRGLPYGKFMRELRAAHVQLDRRMLAELAEKKPEVFTKIVDEVRA